MSDEEEEEGTIRCICGYDNDDGFTIQCEQCLVWQHAVCVRISKNSVPEKYYCEECQPRDGLDPQWARELQRKRRKQKSGKKRKKSSSSSGLGSISNNNQNNNGNQSVLSSPKSASVVGVNSNNNNVSGSQVGGNGKRKGRDAVSADIAEDGDDEDDFYNDFDDYCQDYIPTGRLMVLQETRIPVPLFFSSLDTFHRSLLSDKSSSHSISIRQASVGHGVGYSSRNHHHSGQQQQRSLGLFSTDHIKSYSQIIRLSGLLINRNSRMNAEEPFLFPLSLADDALVIDCRRYGNEARFIRFSCNPNCKMLLFQCVTNFKSEEQSLSLSSNNNGVSSINDPQLISNIEYHDGSRAAFYVALCSLSKSIPPNTELTIPFMYTLPSQHAIEKCACGMGEECRFRPRHHYAAFTPISINRKLWDGSEDPFAPQNDSDASDHEREEKPEIVSPQLSPSIPASLVSSGNNETDDVFSKPEKLLTREERKIRNELLQFAKLEQSRTGGASSKGRKTSVHTKNNSNTSVNESNNHTAGSSLQSSRSASPVASHKNSVVYDQPPLPERPRNMKKAWIGTFMEIDPVDFAEGELDVEQGFEDEVSDAQHDEEEVEVEQIDNDIADQAIIENNELNDSESASVIASNEDIPVERTHAHNKKRKSGLEWSESQEDHVNTSEPLKTEESNAITLGKRPLTEDPPSASGDELPQSKDSPTLQPNGNPTATTRISLKDYKKKRKLMDDKKEGDSLPPTPTTSTAPALAQETTNISTSLVTAASGSS